jgi:hypothetical protein
MRPHIGFVFLEPMRHRIPTDLRGRELILYSEDRIGLDVFSQELALHTVKFARLHPAA